jgi:hypothetical protein
MPIIQPNLLRSTLFKSRYIQYKTGKGDVKKIKKEDICHEVVVHTPRIP